MLAYGLVWDGIRIPLGRAIRDGADRVEEPRDRVALRPRGVAPRRADASGGGRGRRGSRSPAGTRRVGAPPPPPGGGGGRPRGAEPRPVGGSRGEGTGGPPGGGGKQPAPPPSP